MIMSGNPTKTSQGVAALRYTKLNNGFSLQLSGTDLVAALQSDGFIPAALAAQAAKLVVEVAITWEA